MKKLFFLFLLPTLCFGQVFPVKPIGEKAMWIGGVPTQSSVTALETKVSDMKSAYGSVYIHDGTNTVALTTTNYTLVSMWSTDNPQSKAPATNCVALTNGVRVLMAGVYDVSYSISMLGQNNSVVEAGLFVDGVHQDSTEFNRKISTGADVGNASAVGQLVLTSNQLVNVGRITDTAGTYLIVQGSLRLTRISPVSTVDGFNYALKDGSNITDPAEFRTNIQAVGTSQIVQVASTDTATVPSSALLDRKIGALSVYQPARQSGTISTANASGFPAVQCSASGNNAGQFILLKNTTGVSFNVFFGADALTNALANSVAIAAEQSSVRPDYSVFYIAPSTAPRTNVTYCGSGYTNVLVTIAVPASIYTNSIMMFKPYVFTNSAGFFVTNSVWITNVKGYLKVD